jgi:hypothetical protein
MVSKKKRQKDVFIFWQGDHVFSHPSHFETDPEQLPSLILSRQTLFFFLAGVARGNLFPERALQKGRVVYSIIRAKFALCRSNEIEEVRIEIIQR